MGNSDPPQAAKTRGRLPHFKGRYPTLTTSCLLSLFFFFFLFFSLLTPDRRKHTCIHRRSLFTLSAHTGTETQTFLCAHVCMRCLRSISITGLQTMQFDIPTGGLKIKVQKRIFSYPPPVSSTFCSFAFHNIAVRILGEGLRDTQGYGTHTNH